MFAVQLTFVERSLISHIDPPTGPGISGQRKFHIGMNLRNLVDVAERVSANRFDRVHSTTYPRRCHFQSCFKVHGLAMGQRYVAGSTPVRGLKVAVCVLACPSDWKNYCWIFTVPCRSRDRLVSLQSGMYRSSLLFLMSGVLRVVGR